MAKEPGRINVCLIGQKFMGRTHSNAYMKVGKFFDVPVLPVMHTICGRDRRELSEFKDRWGWQNASTDWKRRDREPRDQPGRYRHAQRPASRDVARRAGGRQACRVREAAGGHARGSRVMRDAAKKARKSKTFVWYNYRRVPAVALAHQLVKAGKIGRIYHIRGYYLQDWAGPGVPLIWRFQKKVAGSGSHGDLGAHIIDMARFVAGDEFSEITGGAVGNLHQRAIHPLARLGRGHCGRRCGAAKMGKVDVDDAMLFLARMKSGAVCSIEATRFATGYENKNGVEIHGDKGAIRFNFEDMNHLDFYDATEDRRVQGWHHIMVTHAPDHPYAAAWWPDAHIIGYEHGFINMVADMMNVLGGKRESCRCRILRMRIRRSGCWRRYRSRRRRKGS